MANPDAPQINGVLLTTNIRLIFLEETPGQAQPYKLKFSVNLVDIRGISTEGLFDKRITVNGQSGPNPWMMIFDDIYDIDPATFQVTNKVNLNWMQAHLLELKSKAYR